MMTIDRRTFLAGTLSALAAARLAAAKKPFRRQLVNTFNANPLAGVKIRVNNLTTGNTVKLRTDADGYWDYASLLESIKNPAGEDVEVLIRAGVFDGISFFGLSTRARLWPPDAGGRENRQALRLSLVPQSIPFGFVEYDLYKAWPTFLYEALFGRDRRPEEAGDKLSFGAITAWQVRKILVLLSENLLDSEREFLLDIIPEAVEQLAVGEIRAVDGGVWPANEVPDLKDNVPTGALLIEANEDFPRPSVLHRFDSENPHRIVAAKITLGNLTLQNYFREGEGSSEEIAMARHLVQRSIADALGFSPTMALPNRTLLDATAQTAGTITRTGILYEDTLLGRILYGSGWIVPGARLTVGKDSIVNNA